MNLKMDSWFYQHMSGEVRKALAALAETSPQICADEPHGVFKWLHDTLIGLGVNVNNERVINAAAHLVNNDGLGNRKYLMYYSDIDLLVPIALFAELRSAYNWLQYTLGVGANFSIKAGVDTKFDPYVFDGREDVQLTSECNIVELVVHSTVLNIIDAVTTIGTPMAKAKFSELGDILAEGHQERVQELLEVPSNLSCQWANNVTEAEWEEFLGEARYTKQPEIHRMLFIADNRLLGLNGRRSGVYRLYGGSGILALVAPAVASLPKKMAVQSFTAVITAFEHNLRTSRHSGISLTLMGQCFMGCITNFVVASGVGVFSEAEPPYEFYAAKLPTMAMRHAFTVRDDT